MRDKLSPSPGNQLDIITLDDNNSLLMQACKNENEEIIQYLTEKSTIKSENNSHNRRLASLIKSVNIDLERIKKNPNIEIIQYLTEKSKKPHQQKNPYSNVLYHLMSIGMAINLKSVQDLVEIGADLKIANEHNQTLLHISCSNPAINIEIIKYLIEQGIDPFQVDKDGNYSLIYALKNKIPNLYIIQFLIEKLRQSNHLQ